MSYLKGFMSKGYSVFAKFLLSATIQDDGKRERSDLTTTNYLWLVITKTLLCYQLSNI